MIRSREIRDWVVRQRQIHQTQEEFGRAIGLSQSAISKLEADEAYSFDFDTVVAIALRAGFKNLSEFIAQIEQSPAAVLKLSEKTGKDQAVPSVASHEGSSLPALTLDELETIIRQWSSAALTAVVDAKRRQSGASPGAGESGRDAGSTSVAR